MELFLGKFALIKLMGREGDEENIPFDAIPTVKRICSFIAALCSLVGFLCFDKICEYLRQSVVLTGVVSESPRIPGRRAEMLRCPLC